MGLPHRGWLRIDLFGLSCSRDGGSDGRFSLSVEGEADGCFEPHCADRAGTRPARGDRMDGRGEHYRRTQACPLFQNDRRWPHRLWMGWWGDRLWRPDRRSRRDRSRGDRPGGCRSTQDVPRSRRPPDHPCVGRADRRLSNASADDRSGRVGPRVCGLRLHRQRGGAIASGRQDPRVSRARSSG